MDRPRELLRRVQGMWVLAAVARISYETGAQPVTIDQIAARAGVRARVVKEIFGDRDGCMSAAFQKAAALAGERVIPPFAAEVEPGQRVRIAAMALLAFCEEERELASVCVLGHPATATQRARMIEMLSHIVCDQFDDGLQVAPRNSAATAGVSRAVEMVAARLQDRRPTADLLPRVVEMLLAPHLGPVAARIHAQRPTPILREPRRSGGAGRPSLEMRLTAELLNELANSPGV